MKIPIVVHPLNCPLSNSGWTISGAETLFMPQLDSVSNLKSLDSGKWFLTLNHTILFKHPNINVSLMSAARNKVEAFRSLFGLFPEATIPCQHIYASCIRNNKFSKSHWKSGSAIWQKPSDAAIKIGSILALKTLGNMFSSCLI